jgi:hypothetical protein
MSLTQSLKGEQSQARTRKKIAVAVSQTMSKDFKEIAAASGMSIAVVRKNADHVSIIYAQETRKKQ